MAGNLPSDNLGEQLTGGTDLKNKKSPFDEIQVSARKVLLFLLTAVQLATVGPNLYGAEKSKSQSGIESNSIFDTVEFESEKFFNEVIKGKYGIKLDEKQEPLIKSAIRGIFLGNDITLIDTGLRLFKVPENIRKEIKEELRIRVLALQPFLKKEGTKTLLAYRDITAEIAEIDKRIESLKQQQDILRKKIEEYDKIIATNEARVATNEARVATNEAKAAANEAEAKRLEKIKNDYKAAMEKLKGLKEKLKGEQENKQNLQRQKGPMRA